MKRYLTVLALVTMFPAMGCMAGGAKVTSDPELNVNLPPYNGPRARVAVANFEWKAGGGGGGVRIQDFYGNVYSISAQTQEYMTGLETMLNTALVESNRFVVLERENFNEIKGEIDLGEQGYMEESSRVKKGHVKGADLQIVAAITGWAPDASTRSGGLGGLAGGVLGGAKITRKKSSMAMDIRIYDTRTSEILFAKRVAAEATDYGFAGGALGIFGGIPLAGGLSNFSKTPMEKVIRLCIADAVKKVAEGTPTDYFAYDRPRFQAAAD